jgi:DNA-binding SARP family transcriptional activator/Tfp pilus assembly protein PilF
MLSAIHESPGQAVSNGEREPDRTRRRTPCVTGSGGAAEFRVLGDVAMLVNGDGVELGHARQRCVLAVLLVEANRVVTVEQLLDRVWGDRPPQRSRTTLSSYLSRLRRALAAAGGEVGLTRRPGGYLLTVDPVAVDLHRFRQLVGEAAVAGDGERALAALEQALGLWRGDAFGSLETPWLDEIRVGLAAERLAAELDRNDLALDRGGHAALLGELSSRAGAYPFHERLVGQLMLALYRCGRPADALRGYEQLRQRLAAELGTDPSPPLQTLHKRILRADPGLTVAQPARAPSRSTVPRQLPPLPSSFAGRQPELDILDGLLATDGGSAPTTVVISAVSGTAGVGKTALAAYWAHRVADRFPDGQLYADLRGFDPGGSVMDPAEAVRGFLVALGVPPQRLPAELDAQVALYRSRLAGRRMLVVLDNARDSAQVRPLVAGSPGCLVLVTSRSQLTGLVAGTGAHPLALDLLTTDEAWELLTGRLGPERTKEEPDAVDEIIARSARLPLALTIVAARAATHAGFPLAALAAELRHARTALDVLAGADPAVDVRAVFSWSYRSLREPAARLFRLLSLHPGPDLTAGAAASLAGVPLAAARSQLVELAGASLVTERAPGRYGLHDLLRAYATELAHTREPEPDRRAALHRVLDHYLHTAHTAVRLLDPIRPRIVLNAAERGVTPERLADVTDALAWFGTEHRVLVAAVMQAADHGLDTRTWQLAWTLTGFFHRRGHWHDWASTQGAALAAARRLADRARQAWAHRQLGRALTGLARWDGAFAAFQQALALSGAAGDDVERAHAHLDLGMMWERQGRPAEALDHTEQAFALFRTSGYRWGETDALNNLGWHYATAGRYRLALSCCERALELNREVGHTYGEALTLDSLGYIHHRLGRYRQATACYQQAVGLLRVVSDRANEAETLVRLGDTHRAAGDGDAARDAWLQALSIFDQLDHPDAAGTRTKLAGLAE